MLKKLTRLSRFAAFVAIAGFASAAATESSQAAEPLHLRIASFKTGSSWYVYSVTIGEILRKHLPAGTQVDTPPLGGGTANPLLVSQGKANIGLGFAVANNWARQGTVFFKQPIDNLRGLMGGLDQYYLGIIANGKVDANTLGAYLEKKPDPRVMLMTKGSMGSYAGQQVLDTEGAGEEAVKKAGGDYVFTNFENVQSAFANGSGDLFLQVITKGHPAFTELAQTGDTTFLGLKADVIKSMEQKYGWNSAVLPANSFRGQDKDVPLLGTTTSMIVSADMDDDTAYNIVKAICENLDELHSGHAALKQFSCEKTAWKEELIGLPLHPGAARYYKEKGWIK